MSTDRDLAARGPGPDVMAPAVADEMTQRYAALGEEWLRDHPVIDPPPGFRLEPGLLGPCTSSDERSGWFASDAEDQALYTWPDAAPGRELVAAVALEPEVALIALWAGPYCLWAATRIVRPRPQR